MPKHICRLLVKRLAFDRSIEMQNVCIEPKTIEYCLYDVHDIFCLHLGEIIFSMSAHVYYCLTTFHEGSHCSVAFNFLVVKVKLFVVLEQ